MKKTEARESRLVPSIPSLRRGTNRIVALAVLEVFLLGPSGILAAQPVGQTSQVPRPSQSAKSALPPASQARATLEPGKPAILALGLVKLEVPAGAVSEPTTITVELLSSVSRMNDGMENVTAGVPGYRFTPHGTRFAEPVRLTIPYDKELISASDAQADIYTYFYNDSEHYWQRLPRLAVDTDRGLVTSVTTHFTDFVNSTLSLPESPKPLSYNPNSIKDIKAADPGSGITLIDPPQANGQGTTNLRYPLDLPPGRAGMTPQLAVSYNSGGGNGWMGVGWSLDSSSITIDTRWGVPRYDASLETESYLLDGAELTPLTNREAFVPRTSERTFHTRIEGSFRQIIRHGSSPDSYWWKVTDKTGKRLFYGGLPEANTLDPGSVIRDPGSGSVFTWLLRQERDTNGNTIDYSYAQVSDTGVGNGQASGAPAGFNSYLSTIRYTGSVGTPGPYAVRFVRDRDLGESRRPDVTIGNRPGFEMVTADLLREVTVRYGSEASGWEDVRSYSFSYATGAFEKSLLASISQHGADGSVLATHSFSYYDQIDSGDRFAGFAGQEDWGLGYDSTDTYLSLSPVDLGTGLGTTRSNATGVDFYAGGGSLGGGFTKNNSAGFKVGFNSGSSEGLISLVDLNGDGLADKVFKDRDGTYYYRPNRSGPAGTSVFGNAVPLPSLPGISKERTSTTSAGAENYFGIYVGAQSTSTITTGSAYFSDVNGDGLVDFVRNGVVYFNHLDNQGIPTFNTSSAGTPAPIQSGADASGSALGSLSSIEASLIANSPPIDTVREWIAPFSGTVDISGTVALVGTAPADYTTADGVRVAVQREDHELWHRTIASDDYTAYTPSGVSSIAVNGGDHIYFRTGSNFDGKADEVAWNPVIRYSSIAGIGNPGYTRDANQLDFTSYSAADDFVYSGRSATVHTPVAGTIEISGAIHKAAATSDDVTLVVSVNGTPAGSPVQMSASAAGDFDFDRQIHVNPDDQLSLFMQVDSPIDLSKIQWEPSLQYVAADDPSIPLTDSDGNPTIVVNPLWDIDMYPDPIATGSYTGWIATQDGTESSPLELVARTPAFLPTATPSGPVVLTIKRNGRLLEKKSIDVVDGIGSATIDLTNVSKDDRLYVELSARDRSLIPALQAFGVSLVTPDPQNPGSNIYTPVPYGLHVPVAAGLTAQPNRGWACFGYNGGEGRETQPIDQSLLFIDDQYGKNSIPDAFILYPDPADHEWQGPTNEAWVSGNGMSSARIGDDYPRLPDTSSGGGARAVLRVSVSHQLSASTSELGASGTAADGSSGGNLDFMDLNGDQYPDVVGNSAVQYSLPTGALEADDHAGAGQVRTNTNHFASLGLAGNTPLIIADAKGNVAGTDKGSMGMLMPALGFLSVTFGQGTSNAQSDYMDLNGDGLPDRVSQSGSTIVVSLNTGYGFAPAVAWGDARISSGETRSAPFGVNASFNIGSYSFAGGLSLSSNSSDIKETLLDMNGDGLPDLVIADSNGLEVGINTGAGFAPAKRWSGAVAGKNISDNDTTTLGGGLYFTYAFAIPPIFSVIRIVVSAGGSTSTAVGRTLTSIRDINGDGLADELVSSQSNSVKVSLNQTGQTNLLKEVDRPLGASFRVDYTRTGNTYELPQSKWVMSRLTLTDGHPGDGADQQKKDFSYANGSYNRLEREFLGFSTVSTSDLNQDGSVYRTTEQGYLTGSYYTRGLLARQSIRDANGNLFRETTNTYTLYDVTTQGAFDNQYPYNTVATVFPQLAQTDIADYEGGSSPAVNRQTFDYDRYGNVVQSTDAGDPNVTADDAYIGIQYTGGSGDPEASAHLAAYIVGKPTQLLVTDASGDTLRQRTGTYDEQGNLTRLENYLQGAKNPLYTFGYDTYGNISEEVDPVGYTISYTYDTETYSHITRIADSFGYSSTAAYDLRFGLPTTSSDIAGNTTTRHYDTYGRLDTVYGPYDTDVPALRFAYYPNELPARAVTRNKIHFDPANSATLTTVLLTDGLKRIIQTKKEGEVSTTGGEATTYGMNVTGIVTFDAQGRVIQEGQPVFEAGYDDSYWSGATLVRPTLNRHDVLDRKTLVTLPDASTIRTAYAVSPGYGSTASRLETAVTDPLGNSTIRYTDVRQNTVEVDRFKGSQTLATTYRYDPISEITKVVDAKNNTTTVSYDTLGRRTGIDNPDSGLTSYAYDAAGNLIGKVTPNLRAQGDTINYTYEFDRLKKITYPYSPTVTYTYGDPGAPHNSTGRITSVTDETGTTAFRYGKLGETVWTDRTLDFDVQFNIPDPNAKKGTNQWKIDSPVNHHPESFISRFTYDYLGRMEQMVYPDGETLSYGYDRGGQITTVTGVTQDNRTLPYVKAITYDQFGQRVYLHDGNEVTTSYTYDPNRRWLSHILTADPATGNTLQDTAYRFDKVGDVLSVTNDGYKKVTQTYGYDDLYELTSAQGSYTLPEHPDHPKVDGYSQSFSYDIIGNMLTQTAAHPEKTPASADPDALNYSFTYSYGSAKPHAATAIGNWAYSYDANGNVVEEQWLKNKPAGDYKDEKPGGHADKSLVWDEENRLIRTEGFGGHSEYLYDYNGERVLKDGEGGETWYINHYYQAADNGHQIAKHIFLGDTRIVTRLEHENLHEWNYQEKNIYYYHPDHLGSTTFVTRQDGSEWEHMEYTPYGQAWIDEGTDKKIISYRFTSKEYDQQTGLYAFGKRYLDPQTARWMSPDPAMQAEDPYSYANNNPLRYVDPNGLDPFDTIKKVDEVGLSYAKGVGIGFTGAAKGTFDAAIHPLRTVNAVWAVVTHPAATVSAVIHSVQTGLDKFKSADTKGKAEMIGELAGQNAFAIVTAVGAAEGGAALARLSKGARVLEGGTQAAEESATGIVYKRTNPFTGEEYVGQSKSPERFSARQAEHNRNLGVSHEYEILGTAASGESLDRLEEQMIRSEGGLQKESGTLANKRHQMSEARYDQ